MRIINTKVINAKGGIKTNQVVLTSAMKGDKIFYPVLDCPGNRSQEYDFNVNWFGTATIDKPETGEIKKEPVSVKEVKSTDLLNVIPSDFEIELTEKSRVDLILSTLLEIGYVFIINTEDIK